MIFPQSASCCVLATSATASRTLRLPHVVEYLRRQMQDAFRLEAPRALATLRRLHTEGASEYVQYHAAATLLVPAMGNLINRSNTKR